MFIYRFKTLVTATTLSALLSTPAFCQDVSVDVNDGQTQVRAERQRVDVRRDRDARRPRDAANRSNQQIAKWVVVDQKHIVDLAEYGLQRTKTPEVRELAETIVREHQQLADRLSAMVNADTIPRESRSADEITRDQEQRSGAAEDTVAGSREARRNRDDRRRPLENLGDRLEEGVERVADRTERAIENTREAIRRELNDDQPMRGSVAWVDIHRDIAGEVAKTAQRDLEKVHGYEFDASFVGMLSAAHIQQEATLAVLSNRASGDLASTLEEALQTIRQHKQHADRVMQTIKPQ